MKILINFVISLLALSNVSFIVSIINGNSLPFYYTFRFVIFIQQHLLKYGTFCYCQIKQSVPQSQLIKLVIIAVLVNSFFFVVTELILGTFPETSLYFVKNNQAFKDIHIALQMTLYFILNGFQMIFGILFCGSVMILKKCIKEQKDEIDIEEIQTKIQATVKTIKSEDEDCSICLLGFEDEEEACALVCNHLFHKNCLKKWLKQKVNCPICRKKEIFYQ